MHTRVNEARGCAGKFALLRETEDCVGADSMAHHIVDHAGYRMVTFQWCVDYNEKRMSKREPYPAPASLSFEQLGYTEASHE